MKRPQKPPLLADLLAELRSSSQEPLGEIISKVDGPTVKGQYLHWDKLRRLRPPPGLTTRTWWLGLKLSRRSWRREVPLVDAAGQPFGYTLPDAVLELLHQIDQGAAGSVAMPEEITNPQTRDRYIVSSLIEEAFRSSQIEGALTTRVVAREMIRSNRPPRDRSEQMILNNYLTMQRIRQSRDQDLSPELIFEVHRHVTRKALDDESAAGRFRRLDEPVRVEDLYGEVFYKPPPADQLSDRAKAMCDFANGKTPSYFVHPVIRAIILHFWLAYDHPFGDGNGRCARALFYWSMLRSGYWLCEYISISNVIQRSLVKYYRSFLYAETDDNDLTYFIVYHLKVITEAVRELHAYIKRKSQQIQVADRLLRATVTLNHRQRDLIGHALRHPGADYTFDLHAGAHAVVYQTARTDLLDLADRGLLVVRKIGRRWHFRPAIGLEKKLSELQ